MVIRTKLDPINRDIQLLINEELSPTAQSRALAEFAASELAKAQDVNRSAIGSVPDHETYVDGRRSSDLRKVRPDGFIVFDFNLLGELFAWIDFMLITHSPVKDGDYRRSHILLADGVQIDPDAPLLDAREFVYLNTQPYARKIEGDPRTGRKPSSAQAPDGVYEVIATLAKRRFGNVAKIVFTYRRLAAGATGHDDDRQPAIVVSY